jgi:hypothetical protein
VALFLLFEQENTTPPSNQIKSGELIRKSIKRDVSAMTNRFGEELKDAVQANFVISSGKLMFTRR